ncbi:tRNA-ribosyltransferase family protein [Tsukamurella paurometabola]|nr:tRNA guanosine(34) transglycosylase Tgt [Tsukamurella paurometabola]
METIEEEVVGAVLAGGPVAEPEPAAAADTAPVSPAPVGAHPPGTTGVGTASRAVARQTRAPGPRTVEPVPPDDDRTAPVRVDPALAEIAELRSQNAELAAELAELRTGYRAIAGHTRLRAVGASDPTGFRIEVQGPGAARTGTLSTPHGEIATPAYLPVAARGAVAGITPEMLAALGVQAVTVDLHELYLQPGTAMIEGAGGIGRAMAWAGPVLGDTGITAVAAAKKTRVTDEGIAFRSRLDGGAHRWDPEEAVRVAHRIGVDIAFAMADPVAATAPRAQLEAGVNRSQQWAARALVEHSWQTADRGDRQSLWAVVTGGADAGLRRAAARGLRRLSEQDVQSGGLGFGGYRIDGVRSAAAEALQLRAATEELDRERPRHLATVATPADLFAAIEAGIDLFDGTAAAEAGREGRVFTRDGVLDLTDPQLRADFRPIDPGADRRGPANPADEFTRAYVNHLFAANEGLAVTLCTLHNEHFFATLAADARRALTDGRYPAFTESFLRRFAKV